MGGELKVIRDVFLGDDERVPRRHGEFIQDGEDGRGFGEQFSLWIGGAKGAVSGAGMGHAVVVLVFVDLAVFGAQQVAIGQFNVALVGGDVVFDVDAEAFALEVAPDGEVGFAAGLEQLCNCHEHVRLLFWKQHVKNVGAQNSIEPTLRRIGQVVRIIACDIQPFLAQEVYIRAQPAAEIQQAPM